VIALHTARLTSRPVSITDAPAIFAAYGADPLVARYMTWRVNSDVSDVERYLAMLEPLVAQDRRQVLALAERADPDRLIGTFEARFDAHRMDVGYVLGRIWWGRD
jgi:RimJ/RimL family protein N-acetyltransferase